MKSSSCWEEVLGLNIGGAAREWFFHGKNTYDDRIEKLRLFVDKSKLHPYIPKDTFVSYEERLATWLLDNPRCRLQSPHSGGVEVE
jgi:hypothetical protein